MSVLITGGLGFIGINAAVELLQNNNKVILLDQSEDLSIIDYLNNKFKDNLKYYSINLLNKEQLDEIFEENTDITNVIHSAGYKMVNEGINVLEYYKNNIFITLNLLECMKKYKVKNLIFNSSSNVYEKCEDLNMHIESTKLNLPDNIYGKTKLFIEDILKHVSESDISWNITILRIYNPIGIHPFFVNKFGYELLQKFNHLPTNIIKTLIGEKDCLEIYTNDDKCLNDKFIRDYISILDLSKLYNKLINLMPSGFNIYNVGTGKGYSIIDLINIFEKISDKKVNYIIKKVDKFIINKSIANIQKIKNDIKWQPENSIEFSCKNIINTFKNK